MRTGTAAVVLLAAALSAGCTTAGSTPPAPPASTPAAAAAQAAPAAPAQAPGDLGVATVESRESGSGPQGAPVVRWSVDWQLRWSPVPGAVSYAVRYASAEGVPAGSAPQRTTEDTSLRVTAAAGTSAPERHAAERDAGLLFTSSQLLVSVSGVGADGTEGPATGWIPVGDVPPDGRPLTTLPHRHAPGGHADGHTDGHTDGHADEGAGHEHPPAPHPSE
ncbi:hypothetical protein [Kineococcus sp. SYSU DK006]|uniref:hypothetical protein n=1 Tax=Kineococcus sp. SYSU DK006 TaxID=3383127 RepID=UPI003D7D5E2B